jgi:hypothetical protein
VRPIVNDGGAAALASKCLTPLAAQIFHGGESGRSALKWMCVDGDENDLRMTAPHHGPARPDLVVDVHPAELYLRRADAPGHELRDGGRTLGRVAGAGHHDPGQMGAVI